MAIKSNDEGHIACSTCMKHSTRQDQRHRKISNYDMAGSSSQFACPIYVQANAIAGLPPTLA